MYHPYFDHEFYGGQPGYERLMRFASEPRASSSSKPERKEPPPKPVLVYGYLFWL